ncbi:polysialyltransferase family glycosyltransferase [Variovorax sp. VNK109]|uniref:polysialyltransferase family glycosyltransferase n=1 Tax=Variovorax sp. VNK109 TaxID=3400919 RepID=UPI003C0D0EF5
MTIERLIVCQGTAQLVTAVAALRAHMARSTARSESQQSREHLLICGLAVADESQAEEFATVIEKMAALLHPFATITRLADKRLEQLLAEARSASSASGIAALLHQATGIGEIDEVFTVRDWQSCNVLALSAYPDALHVCYGDSVGVYLPKGFMAPPPSLRSRIALWLRHVMSPIPALLASPRLDVSYLLLPEAFSLPPSGDVVRTEAAVLRDLFHILSPLLNATAMDDLYVRVADRSVWVLMGSNFSEQGLMTLEQELDAYCEWIEGLLPSPDTVLLIKSHPRDRRGKRELLETRLRRQFGEVWSADFLGSAYLPIEVLLLNLKPVVASLRTLTVSTACLAAHFVVKSRNHIGFGDTIVRRYVMANRRRERLEHERELRRLCMRLTDDDRPEMI